MKVVWLTVICFCLAQTVRTHDEGLRPLNPENKVFIITLDGLRWQEVFLGADSALLSQPLYNTDTATTKDRFWHSSPAERRRKLMPFFWSNIASQGQLYGNRSLHNKMNVANPYALSYPGYNELLTGRVDYTVFGNGRSSNTNITFLDLLNTTAAFRGKVAAFTSWNAFPFILNSERSNIHINSGPLHQTDDSYAWLGQLRETIKEEKTTRDDAETYRRCKEFIAEKKPSVVLLGFGGTDEAAHDKRYDQYLQQAASADKMIGDLWRYLQTLPDYAGRTTFLITTDHGRGAGVQDWHTHGTFVGGSSQTWMALLGKGIHASGELTTKGQYYQKDLKGLVMKMLSH